MVQNLARDDANESSWSTLRDCLCCLVTGIGRFKPYDRQYCQCRWRVHLLVAQLSVNDGGMPRVLRGTITFLTTGEILPRTSSYVPMFMIAGSACLIAPWIFHLVAQPKLEPARVN